jgi:hypothetical protein
MDGAMKAAILLLASAAALSASDVEGRIVNSMDGRPVKRAYVSLSGVPSAISTAAPENYTCQTDAEGRFAVVNVAAGAYEVNALREGYQNNAPGVQRQITVRAGRDIKDIELRLIPLAVVMGRVVDENGRGIANVQVMAMRYKYSTGRRELRPVKSSETDDRGEFRIATLSPGRWYLRAQKSGVEFHAGMVTRGPVRERVYETAYYGGVDAERAQGIDLTAGAQRDHLDIPMPRVPIYAVRLRAPPGAAIRVGGGSADLHGYLIRTLDTPGFVEIYGLPRGTYTIASEAMTRNFTSRGIAQKRVEITDHDLDGIDLATPTAVEITGKVTGLAVEGLRVRLKPDEDGAARVIDSPVRPDGAFTASALAGDYIVGLAGPGTIYLSGMRSGERVAGDHRLRVGKDSGTLQLTASNETGKVEGVVETAAGLPAVRALVTLVPDQSLPYWIDMYKTTRTNASGIFSISEVVPGGYRAYAWQENDPESPMDPDFRKPFEELGAPVKVSSNGSAAVKLVMIGTR